MAAKKKTPTPLDPQPDPRDILLARAQQVLHDLSEASGIGTIAVWQFNRARAHRKDPNCVSNLLKELTDLLGPIPPETEPSPPGVQFNDS